MRSHLEPYPAGQFPYYSGLTSRHIGWLRPVKFTTLCEVTDSRFDESSFKMRFNRETGRLMGSSLIRAYLHPRDFDAMLDARELGQ